MELQDFSLPWISSVVLTSIAIWILRVVGSRHKQQQQPHPQQAQGRVNRLTQSHALTATNAECEPYKNLYFKLHNLEDHGDILPHAKDLLLSLFSDALLVEKEKCNDKSILSISDFSVNKLNAFVRAELDTVVKEWQDYLDGRKNGECRELFQDVADARRWLVQKAPLKLVDGAWLGYVHNATVPFAYRRVTRAAWQVLSEELGDGDLAKCHAYLYSQLLSKVDAPAPAPDSEEFTRHDGMDDITVWRSALAQLLISLFGEEFLPEMLGFNLNFEMMTLDTLVTAKELKEVGIDPYYFTLHITIDNADTGHTAMASNIVVDYMSLVASRYGDAAAQQAWKRVQTGYILSKNMAQAASSSFEDGIIEIFMAKSVAADGLHDACPVKIGGRKLSDWLDPAVFRDRKCQTEFLQCLRNAKPWVYKGNSSCSRLVRQISWGGSMFGAFTDRELSVLKGWIDSLSLPGPDTYEAYCGGKDFHESATGISSLRYRDTSALNDFNEPHMPSITAPDLTLDDISKVDTDKLLSIWFSHTCLLESFVSVPWRVSNNTGCAIIRLLRAQYGFLPEPDCVYGTDELNRSGQTDLIEMGVEMFSKVYPERPQPGNLEDVLKMWPSPFAEAMTAVSWRPREFQWRLLGMTNAFIKLHDAVASSSAFLSNPQRAALRAIADRERDAISHCVEGVSAGSPEKLDFDKGHNVALREIMACLGC